MTSISLRPAVPADTEFCYQLHKAAMGDYIAAIWGWDELVQRDFHTRAFNPGCWQIITAGGADVGMLNVEYRPGEIYLSRIEIHPGQQGHGIGTRLISAILDEAAQKGQDLRASRVIPCPAACSRRMADLLPQEAACLLP